MLGELSALGAALTWATVGSISKVLVGRMNIIAINAIRSLIATILVVPLALALGRGSDIIHIPLSNLLYLLGSNFLFLIADLIFLIALSRGNLSRIFPVSTGVYIATGILGSAVIAREPLGWGVPFGATLVAIGVILASSSQNKQWWTRKELFTGIFRLSMLAGILWTAGALLLNSGVEDVDALAAFAIRVPATAIMMVPFLFGKDVFTRRGYSSSTIWMLLFTGVAFTLSAFLYQAALLHTSVASAAALASTSSIFAIPMGFALGDRLLLRNIQGVALAVAGIWLLILL